MPSYPYSLIPTPPVDCKNDMYDLHVIRMAAIHNIFIRAFNSVYYHAPSVGPNDVPGFVKYCITIANSLHEHHTIEETVISPALESKLGKGAMDGNVAQHKDFMPKFSEWAELCKKIAAKEADYNTTEFLNLFRTSTDILSSHFVDETLTMESSMLKKHFSEVELQDIETNIDKKAQEIALLWNTPLILVNTDPSFNSWFPPGRYISLTAYNKL